MRCSIAFASVCVLLAVVAFAAPANDSKAPAAFQQLKSLAGSWEGKNSMGEALQVSFKVTSGGSALLSEIQGHTIAEIAATLGITVNTALVRLKRARREIGDWKNSENAGRGK